MAKSYEADSIEVLEGLEPVKKRPGMYTDTTRPNHLAQEVIDNSVDEALEGYATEIRVTLRKDGSMSVSDDGRGMPVDVHKKEKLPGVELILTRLHSGAKFNSDSYKFSGGLHGVGVSVVNALSETFEVYIKREGKLHHMAFRDGKKKGKSRPGRVKRAGASCKGSVTSLRAKAKKYGGEKGKMYHWCANMKSGRKKK